MTTHPTLIQRMTRRDNEYKKGIDSKFSMDYMGSAEFEFGELPRALAQMRQACEKWRPLELKTSGHVLWFVGDLKGAEIAIDIVRDHLQWPNNKLRTKEPTGLRDSLEKSEDSGFRFDGWWALDAHPPFALFLRKEDAELWLEILRNPPPKEKS